MAKLPPYLQGGLTSPENRLFTIDLPGCPLSSHQMNKPLNYYHGAISRLRRQAKALKSKALKSKEEQTPVLLLSFLAEEWDNYGPHIALTDTAHPVTSKHLPFS